MTSKSSLESPLVDHYPSDTPMMNFGGWTMPRDFGGIVEEHNMVREDAGVFDLSHMGRLVLKHESIKDSFQRLFTRDIVGVDSGRALYGFLCHEDGGCIDDIIVYVRSDDELWLVVNAGNRTTVVDWIKTKTPEIKLDDRTKSSILLAMQGPSAANYFESLALPSCPSKPFCAKWDDGAMVASTGYTGESGGEAWLPIDRGKDVFQEALNMGLRPCGLGARDTLRLEMGYPLHGHELSEDIDPVTANLDFFIDWDHKFIGRGALEDARDHGTTHRVTGIRLDSRRSPRESQDVRVSDGKTVGEVTSGRYSPILGVGIGMVCIKSTVSSQQELEINIRDDWYEATQLEPPFITKEST